MVVRIIQDTNVVLHEFPGVETTVFSIVQSIRPHARHARANAHLEVLFVDVVDGPLQLDLGSAGVLDSDLDEEHVHPRGFGRENTAGDGLPVREVEARGAGRRAERRLRSVGR